MNVRVHNSKVEELIRSEAEEVINDNRGTLINICKENDLVITNTIYIFINSYEKFPARK